MKRPIGRFYRAQVKECLFAPLFRTKSAAIGLITAYPYKFSLPTYSALF